ncbi:MAG: DUF4349 domain-containing protein [Solirubrobacteraceae bacterium]|nr:DUF4349 domain-containing protein [Solirubrobacteraceae bacterium]
MTPEQERELDALDRAIAGDPVEYELRELEELVRDVRATAPEMAPAFAARLEQEVQDGFPTSQQRVPVTVRRPWRGRRWMLLPALGSLTAVLVALVVVFGSSSDSLSGGSSGDVPNSLSSGGSEAAAPAAGGAADSAAGGSAGGPDVDTAAREPQAAPAAPSASTVAPDPAGGAIAPARTRKVERSAVLALRTPDAEFERTTAAVLATVARFGGIVASSQIGESDAAGGEATYDLRIPTGRLDRALAALSKLGHVTERSQSLQDITASFRSAQERLTDARAERRGLLRALERATTQNRIDSLKAQLRTVSSRIAGLKGELASLRRRADLSRVDLTVRGGGSASGSAGGGGSWTPGDAAGDALRVLEVLAGVALVALAVLVPLALLGAAVALGVRGGRRRRRESALDPA